MRVFTSNELARMRATQESAMMDTCVRLQRSEAAADDYGRPQPVYSEAETLSCGFDPSKSKEVMDGTQVVLTDAVLRLPIGTEISNLDRIKITHRHGEALTNAPVYAIVGEPLRGPSGLVLNLRLVADEGVG